MDSRKLFEKTGKEATGSQFQTDKEQGRPRYGWGMGILSRPCGEVLILFLAKLGSPRVSRWR